MIKAKKSLGQNFLIDQNIINKIINLVDIKNKNILCIGDNLNTDIKGANLQNFSSLFISSGIHKNETNLSLTFKNHNVRVDYLQSYLKW